jgi:hypothetical protein
MERNLRMLGDGMTAVAVADDRGDFNRELSQFGMQQQQELHVSLLSGVF